MDTGLVPDGQTDTDVLSPSVLQSFITASPPFTPSDLIPAALLTLSYDEAQTGLMMDGITCTII